MKFIEYLLDLLFPPTCGFCESINNNYLCDECKNRILKLEKTKLNFYKNKYFIEHMWMFPYQGELRQKIIDYKFYDNAHLYKTFSALILNNKKVVSFIKNFDYIVAVPISKKRKKTRGYNQSELIIKDVIYSINISSKCEYIKNLIIKTKDIEAQSSMKTREERAKNVKDVYEISNQIDLENKSILIFDDIFTTGSTVNECAKVISKLKPNKISVLTIAKD